MLELADIRVRTDVVAHPLLGDAHVIEGTGGPLTAMTVIEWDRPTRIPTIAEPGRLPPGAGGALLNELARRAVRAGVAALRYAGPYPTPGLWRALGRSFRTAGSEAEFTADVLGRALRLAFDEISIDFAPAPHERIAHGAGWVELRDGIERAVIDDVAYERDGSPARLLDGRAELWFGNACYARIASFDPRGALIDGPHPPPAIGSAVLGHAFPPALRAALAELIADVVPAPLAADARAIAAARPIAWADLGARAARRTDTGFEVHAALWERIAPLGLARLALALAEALAPVVTSSILRELTRR
jgi:hypothetical protein